MAWKNVKYKDGKYKTDNSGGGSSGHDYSTTEQKIGTWIDGKPLYEKTIHKVNDVAFADGLLIDTGISNADIIFIYEAHFLDYGQNVFATLPYFQSPSNLQDYLSVGIDTSTNKIKVASNTSYSVNNNRYLDVVIRYTKTTD